MSSVRRVSIQSTRGNRASSRKFSDGRTVDGWPNEKGFGPVNIWPDIAMRLGKHNRNGRSEKASNRIPVPP